jgi:hypothetical protein
MLYRFGEREKLLQACFKERIDVRRHCYSME